MDQKNVDNKVTLGNIKVFEKNADGYDENCDVQYRHGKETIKDAIKRVCEIVKKEDLKKLRVLDAGCGNGRTTINLYIELRKALIKIQSDIDIVVIGIDISKKMLEMASINAQIEGISNKKVIFYNKNIEELSQKDGYFDLIFSNFALHLCTPNVYARFMDRLNKNGILAVNIGGKNNCNNLYEIAFELTKEEELAPYFESFILPVFYPTKDEMNEVLKKSGFSNIVIVEQEYRDFNYEQMIKTFINASLLLFLEQLPNKDLRDLFVQKYYKKSKIELNKYKHVHKLYITAVK